MNKKIILIGAGGHGLVAADIAKLNGYEEIMFLDDNLTKSYNYPIIDTIKHINKYSDYDFFVSIGNNQLREKLLSFLDDNMFNVVTLIHPSAIISDNVDIGIGSILMAGVIINCKTIIGKGVILNTGTTIDHENNISNYVHLSPGCHTSGQVTIGENTWLGTGCIVINNINICSQCIIGAGGLVIKDIVVSGTYVGNPVRRI